MTEISHQECHSAIKGPLNMTRGALIAAIEALSVVQLRQEAFVFPAFFDVFAPRSDCSIF